MDLENVICIITKNLVNVAMRSDAWFYNIFMELYNKNILKYDDKILVTSGRFMIFHIEGYSIAYPIRAGGSIFIGFLLLFLFISLPKKVPGLNKSDKSTSFLSNLPPSKDAFQD